MIRVEATAEGVIFRPAGLEPGLAAYVDADWIGGSPSEVPALVVDAGRSDADALAGTALVRLAERTAAAVGAAGSAVVLGSGTVARHVARLLAERGIRAPEGDPPAAIVEATGDPESLVAALQQVATLGTVVLAGEPLGRPVSLELYPDLHVRGLTLVGVSRPRLPSAGEAHSLPEAVRAELASVTSGAVVPEDAGWYRLTV